MVSKLTSVFIEVGAKVDPAGFRKAKALTTNLNDDYKKLNTRSGLLGNSSTGINRINKSFLGLSRSVKDAKDEVRKLNSEIDKIPSQTNTNVSTSSSGIGRGATALILGALGGTAARQTFIINELLTEFREVQQQQGNESLRDFLTRFIALNPVSSTTQSTGIAGAFETLTAAVTGKGFTSSDFFEKDADGKIKNDIARSIATNNSFSPLETAIRDFSSGNGSILDILRAFIVTNQGLTNPKDIQRFNEIKDDFSIGGTDIAGVFNRANPNETRLTTQLRNAILDPNFSSRQGGVDFSQLVGAENQRLSRLDEAFVENEKIIDAYIVAQEGLTTATLALTNTFQALGETVDNINNSQQFSEDGQNILRNRFNIDITSNNG